LGRIIKESALSAPKKQNLKKFKKVLKQGTVDRFYGEPVLPGNTSEGNPACHTVMYYNRYYATIQPV